MKVAVFSAQDYDRAYLQKANSEASHQLFFFEEHLDIDSAKLADGFEIVCCFVLDDLSDIVLEKLAQGGTKLIALRSVGYDHVDLAAAERLNITVVNVPTYSPNAVAELAVMLVLMLARRFLESYRQFEQDNYSLDKLLGFSLKERSVGIIGTGHIGVEFAKMVSGFGCKVFACDPVQNDICLELGIQYLELEELLKQCDVISLHCLLNEQTKYMINAKSLQHCKKTALLINTSRGGIVDTKAVLNALNNNQLGGFGTDVYEYEKGLFFSDRSGDPITDKLFLELRSHPKVIVTGHQAFFTEEAITNIARTTINNISRYLRGESKNQVRLIARRFYV